MHALLLLAALLQVAPAAPAPMRQAFVGVHVVPLVQDGVVADRTVLIHGDRIEAILPADAALPDGTVRIEAAGRYLIPGLIDCYSHADAEEHLLPFVANGITTVKDSPAPIEHLGMRDRVLRGELLGPTLFCSSMGLDDDQANPLVETLTSPDQARRVVGECARLGYDALMVYPGLSKPVYEAVVEESERLHLPLMGQICPGGDIAALAAGNQRSVENLVGLIDFTTGAIPYPEPKARAIARALRDGGLACIPTLTVHTLRGDDDEAARAERPEFRYFSPSMRALLGEPGEYDYGGARRLVELYHEEGLPILFGTDACYPLILPGFSAHGPDGELANLVEAGLSPYEALIGATREAAALLGLGAEIGTIEVGKRADLVLLEANPLEDVAHAARIAGVMLRGRWLPHDELQRLLEQQALSWTRPPPRFEGLPALPEDGEEELAAVYDIQVSGLTVGQERLARRRLADGSRVLVAQSSIDSWYSTRTTVRIETGTDGVDRRVVVDREAIDGRSHVELRHEGESARCLGTRPAYGDLDFTEPLPAGVLFGGPMLSNGLHSDTIANFVHALEGLDDLEIGATRDASLRLIELNSAEFFRNATLGDMRWTIRRGPDVAVGPAGASRNARAYEITTSGRAGRGEYDATVLADERGLPIEVRAGTSEPWTWTYRRVAP